MNKSAGTILFFIYPLVPYLIRSYESHGKV